ncbi:MAG: elongation factor G [Firmicutes bacterium]|nr:elongation factor G [Bacillota bacterium]
MKQYPIDKLRNVSLVAHGGVGKTSLTEALLYTSKAIDRLGNVMEGNTVSDYDPEEVNRSVSISASLAPVEWKGHKINLIDTPGYFDFVGEVRGALRVSDAAVVMVCAVSGVEVGTEKVWNYCNEREIPRAFFINKMDRENANFDRTLEQLRQSFGLSVAPVTLPIGAEANFSGIVDLVTMKAYNFTDNGRKLEEREIPAELNAKVEEYRTALIEVVAETDDELLMKYLEGEPLTDEEITNGVRESVASGQLVPVFCGSAVKNIGSQMLLDMIVSSFPSPAQAGSVTGVNPKTDEEVTRNIAVDEPFSALVFKTMADPYVGKLSLFKVYSGVLKSDSQVYNVNKDVTERIGQLFVIRGKNQEPVPQIAAGDIGAVAKLNETTTADTLAEKDKPIRYAPISFPDPVMSLAVEAAAKGDEDRIGTGLARLVEEDPTLRVRRDAETNQLLISGMGDLHLDVITSKLSKKYGANVDLVTPKVPYRETIRGNTRVEGRHKKQSGGKGQYGHVWLEMGPSEPGAGLVFEDKIFGGAVPRQYIPAVEKGVRETMDEGVLAGYPVVDVRVALVDGSYHTVDSSEMAFKIAASMAFKKGFMECRPVLLEPIMNVEVTVPEQYMGDIIGDLNKKRGRVLGMEPQGNFQVVRAMVPLAEMFRYATDLRSITQGRASFTMSMAAYEEVPAHIAEAIIAESKKED